MTRRLVTLIVFTLALAGLDTACNSRDPVRPEGGTPYLIEHIDRGCSLGSEVFTSVQGGEARLTGYSVFGDTLSLDVHFQANCCPAFVEDVVFGPGSISLDVGDTLYQCRCICSYDNTFRIHWPESGPLAFQFASRQYGSPTAICAFDTLIVIPD